MLSDHLEMSVGLDPEPHHGKVSPLPLSPPGRSALPDAALFWAPLSFDKMGAGLRLRAFGKQLVSRAILLSILFFCKTT